MNPHERQCKICNFDGEVSLELSNNEIAEIVDCSPRSVGRHRDYLASIRPDMSDPENVVWEPVKKWGKEDDPSYSYVRRTDAQSLSYEDIKHIFEDFDYEPANLDAPTGGTELLVDADPQIGKADEHGGGTKETLARCQSSIRNAMGRYSVLRPSELFYLDGGDPIENCFNTPKQLAGNDMPPNQQVLVAVRQKMDSIRALLPYTDRLVYGAVTSNHGEVRIAPGQAAFNSEADWGLTILEILRDRCEDAGLPVEFIRPERLEDTLVFTTQDGTKVAINHGHHAPSGKIEAIKKWIMGQDHGRRPGWDADIWIMNHFHHPYHDSIGNGRSVLGTPSNDPGSLWVAKNTGESSKPGMLALSVANGGWSNYSVL